MLTNHSIMAQLRTFVSTHKFLLLFLVCSVFFCVADIQLVNAAPEVGAGATAAAAAPAPYDHFAGFKSFAMLYYGLALGIGGLAVFIGGLTLDLSIVELVIKFGTLFNTAFGQGIISVWQIIRDIFNIVFIFAFIFIGIKTILNSDDSGTKRLIGNLIVAALFINFSLLISQAIMDFSNVAAIQIYNHITTGGVGASGIDGTFSNDMMKLGQNSLSGAFLNATNLTTLFGGDSNIITDPKFTTMKILVYSTLMMVFLILAGFVFLYAAIHIIYRFVALMIYMILSPVLFAGLILPNFQSYTKKWLHGLLKQSFFAPAFLFLVYVSLLSLTTLKDTLIKGTGNYQELTKAGAMDINEFGIFLLFAIAFGFLYASVKVGDMMGIAGAGTVLKMGDSARKGIQGAMYRGTVGWGLNKVVKGIDAIDRKAEAGSEGARFARTIFGGESTRRAVEKASNYGAGGLGRDAAEKQNKERSQRAARGTQIENINRAIKAGSNATPGSPAQIALEQAVSSASSGHLIEMLDDAKENSPEYAAIVSNMSQDQYDSVMKEKPEVFNDAQKTALARARSKAVRERLLPPVQQGQTRTPAQENSELIKAIKEKASTDELLALGFDEIRSKSEFIPASKMDDLLKKNKLTETQKRLLSDERKTKIENATNTELNAIVSDQKAKDIAKLPKKLFTDPASIAMMMPHIKGGVLEVIGSASGENMILNQSERRALKTAVMATGTLDAKAYLNTKKGRENFQ